MLDTKVSLDINQGRFATTEEINLMAEIVDYEKGIGNASGVTVCTDGKMGRVHEDDSFYGVVGGTASKKTRDVIAPTIVNNAIAGNSMIINDVKGELYKLTSKLLKKYKYKVLVLNFDHPEKGDAYNPISPIYRDYTSGEKGRANRRLNNFSEIMFSSVKSEKDPFWHITASNYFSGLMLTSFDSFDKKYATNINNAIALHMQGNKRFGGSTYMREFFSDKENSEAWKMIAPTVTAPNETRGSINAVFFSAINKLLGQNKAIINMLSHSTFGIEEFVENKVALFIIANEESLSVYAELITALIQQWYYLLISVADETNGVLKRKVAFILDEFGNLPPFKDFGVMISLARARNISFIISLQSFAQLESQYGNDVAKTIVGNTANWIYLFSADVEMNELISKITGELTDESGRTRNLMTANQLRHLKKTTEEGLTECLMLLGRLHPVVCYLPDITEYFGIEPIDSIDIPFREDEETPEIDFCSLVEANKKDKIQKLLDEADHERKKINLEMKSKRDFLIKQDPFMLEVIMNDVIGKLMNGGRI